MKAFFYTVGHPSGAIKEATAGRRKVNFVTISGLDELLARFAGPVFVKPSSLGSSVGVSRAASRDELNAGIEQAAQFDYKVIVEEAAVDCREVEVAILGNEDPQATEDKPKRSAEDLRKAESAVKRNKKKGKGR